MIGEAHQMVPIPVKTVGIGPTTIGVFMLNLLSIGGFGAWLTTRPKMRALTLNRIDKLEQRLDQQQARNEIERRLMRHRMNNAEGALDAFIQLLKLANGNPEMIQRAIVAAEETRDRHKTQANAERQAAIQAIATLTRKPADEVELEV